ncbi:MAG TPA: EscU/YscU/HrcU family type III secretion system export apparatus switch protein [Bryobacteraceae bacterium]|nr:EscU/YscU/HrcU family type III secretion system export apparatus switch protein [Bryobacteraceae bacterium]
MADRDQKTEQPTQRRLKKAREEGSFPTARVFVGALQFLAFVTLLHAWGLGWLLAIRSDIIAVLQHALDPRLSAAEITELSLDLIKRAMVPLATLGAALIAITLAVQLGVTRFGVSLKKLAPDLKRLSPLAKLRDLPKQSLSSLLQAAVMIPAFGAAVYFLVKDDFQNFLSLPLRSATAGAAYVAGSIQSLLWKASMVFVVFGAVDLVRQKRRYQQDLRMSKQEIRDEFKEIEGSPLMKQRVRRLRRDMARRRMMHEVPTATAVIVNPTHYAVALKYVMNTPGAPRVVAKGKNYLALRIRKKAIEHNVPLIENPPLAQALYKGVDVGQEIPAHFYKAVAEVLAYIFRLMNGRRPA